MRDATVAVTAETTIAVTMIDVGIAMIATGAVGMALEIEIVSA